MSQHPDPPSTVSEHLPPEGAMQIMLACRQVGVTDRAVLAALESTPRHLFVEALFADQAYGNTALPIPCGQTISQPAVVALMTEALEVGPRDRVLEIGTGSGYQAAVLARLCRRVYTVERHPTLYRVAKKRFERLRLQNVTTKLGDGTRGWPEQAPFDRIIVTAAAEEPPSILLDQLKEGGIMVLPVGAEGGAQVLLRVERRSEGPVYEELGEVRFVPLLEGVAVE